MVRARAGTKQGLGGPCRRRRRRTATGWLLDGHEALPLQALEHREHRRQWFPARAVMPAPVRDRDLDEGGQELGRRPLVTRLHCHAPKPTPPAARRRASQFLTVKYFTKVKGNFCDNAPIRESCHARNSADSDDLWNDWGDVPGLPGARTKTTNVYLHARGEEGMGPVYQRSARRLAH